MSEDHSADQSSTFSGIRWSSASQAIVAATRLLSGIVLFKLLSVEVIGIAAMAHVVTGFAHQLRELGTRMAIVQRPQINREILDSAFFVNIAVGLGLALGVAAVSPLATAFYRDEALLLPLLVLSVIFPIGGLGQVHRALLTREMLFARLGAIDAGAALVQAGLAIGLAWGGWGIWSIVMGEIGFAVVAVGAAWLLRPWCPGLRVRRAAVRELLGFGANLMGFNLANYFFQNADRLIIGRVLGAEALGLYAFAQRLTLFPIRTLGSALSNVLVPRLSRDQNDPESFERNFVRASAGALLLALPVLGALAILIEPLVQIYDSKWLPAVVLVALLCPVGAVQSVSRTLGPALIARGRPDVLFRIGLLVGSAVLLGSLLGVRYGVVGVATAFLASTSLTAVAAFVITARTVEIRLAALGVGLLPLLAIGSVTLTAMLGMRFLLEAWGIEPWIVVATAGSLGAVLYWRLVIAFGSSVYQDLRRLLGLTAAARPSPTAN